MGKIISASSLFQVGINKKKIRSIGPFLLPDPTAQQNKRVKTGHILSRKYDTSLQLKNYLKENLWSN